MKNANELEVTMEELAAMIHTADKDEIVKIICIAARRYVELYPNWDITAMSREKGKDRNEQIDHVIALLESLKE